MTKFRMRQPRGLDGRHWAEQNAQRIQSFVLPAKAIMGHSRNDWSVEFEADTESITDCNIVIKEIMRYAGFLEAIK